MSVFIHCSRSVPGWARSILFRIGCLVFPFLLGPVGLFVQSWLQIWVLDIGCV